MKALNDQIVYCLATADICAADDMPEEEQMLREIANSLSIFQNLTRNSADLAVAIAPTKEEDH